MKINFWFLVQPFATLGFVKQFFSIAPKNVEKNVFILKGQVSDRKKLDVDAFRIDDSKIYLVESINELEISETIFENSINICFDFNSPFIYVLKKAKETFPSIKLFIASELDTFGKMLGRFSFLDYKARRNYRIHHQYVDGVLAFGDAAYYCFRKMGWKRVYSCHYLPDIKRSNNCNFINEKNSGYLYIGRNDFFYKRLNYLLKYFKCNSNLNLTIVGDYGNNCDKVEKIVNKLPNVKRIKAIPVQDVFKIIESKVYKCVLIPSRYDACNVNVYMCIMAGHPFICSTGTGESLIAKDAKCAFVFKNSYFRFKKTMNNFEKLSYEELNKYSLNTYNNYSLSSKNIMESLYNEICKE